MTKKPIPKRIADAPSPPERHEPIANAVDELFTYYRESIAEYRKLTPEARRVKDRASWLVQGDFASQLPDKQMSKISELELALKCAEPMLATLNALHCSELGPDDLDELFDATDRLAISMHELGRIAGEIAWREKKDPPGKGKSLLEIHTMKEADRIERSYPSTNKLAKALLSFTEDNAERLGHKKWNENDEDSNVRTITRWLKKHRPS